MRISLEGWFDVLGEIAIGPAGRWADWIDDSVPEQLSLLFMPISFFVFAILIVVCGLIAILLLILITPFIWFFEGVREAVR